MIHILEQQRILPAVTFSSIQDVAPVTQALMQGGLSIMEIALRTGTAFASIRTIAQDLPAICIGAGTILTISQLYQAIDAGASFGLSPAFNPVVVREANRLNFLFIPGVMTPSEIEAAVDQGCNILKLFPASSIGGLSFLKALQGPYARLNVQFIPMGGVNLQNMKDYLAIEKVIAVGGSWLAHEALIRNKEYAVIEQNAREALQISSKKSE